MNHEKSEDNVSFSGLRFSVGVLFTNSQFGEGEVWFANAKFGTLTLNAIRVCHSGQSKN